MDLRKDFQTGELSLINFVNLKETEKELVRRWRNHPDVKRWMYSSETISSEEHHRFIEGLSRTDRSFYWLVKKGGEPIGVIYLTKTDFKNRNAYLGIYADPRSKGSGYGRNLVASLKELVFGVADFHTLKLEVFEDNERAIRFYQKAGFQEEGRLKEVVLKNGRWKDVVILGIIQRETVLS